MRRLVEEVTRIWAWLFRRDPAAVRARALQREIRFLRSLGTAARRAREAQAASHPIRWQGETVGYLEDLQAEMYHRYGRWRPEGTPKAREFERILTSGEPDGVVTLEVELSWNGRLSIGEASMDAIGEWLNVFVPPTASR